MSDLTLPVPDQADAGRLPDELVAVDDVRLAALHERLVREAERQDLLDVAYQVVESPVGRLLLAATSAGLVRVAFEVEDHDRVLEAVARRVGGRVLAAPGRLDEAARQVDEYLAGRRTDFDLLVDLRLTAGFRRTVLDHLRRVGYGRTVSYAALAAQSGSPRAVRAVGSACATNPLPIVVPCHRVLRSDGSLGGYVGGLPVKERLLSLEHGAA